MNNNLNQTQEVVATIGFFDGVHRGHRWLIAETQRVATEQGKESAVVTFANHPRTVVQPNFTPQLIDTPSEKLELLANTGVTHVIALEFDRAMSQLSARDFLALLHQRYAITTLLLGYDHRFGRGRSEGFEEYVTYGRELGIEVIRGERFAPDGEQVSSSIIRSLLEQGEMERANLLLGSRFTLSGCVVHGHKMGRTIQFPTANIVVAESCKLIPRQGCYAIYAHWEGCRYGGMLNIGIRPTVGENTNYSIEAHLFDFSGDLYDATLTVELVSYLRPERKMGSLEELKEQLQRDKALALARLENCK